MPDLSELVWMTPDMVTLLHRTCLTGSFDHIWLVTLRTHRAVKQCLEIRQFCLWFLSVLLPAVIFNQRVLNLGNWDPKEHWVELRAERVLEKWVQVQVDLAQLRRVLLLDWAKLELNWLLIAPQNFLNLNFLLLSQKALRLFWSQLRLLIEPTRNFCTGIFDELTECLSLR